MTVLLLRFGKRALIEDKGNGPRRGRKSLSLKGTSPRINVRLSAEQLEIFIKLGGARWLRRELQMVISGEIK